MRTAIKESIVNRTVKAYVDGIFDVRQQQSEALTCNQNETLKGIGSKRWRHKIDTDSQENNLHRGCHSLPNREERQPSSGGGTRRGGKTK